ncbi:MAG: GntR family transcriptional regulator [Clostridiaceae bacterium]|nr:GntR family transcriptional regulator [Clostridiaceae bacterium]
MIVVDLRSSKPIYEQIRDNIKQLIITGAIKQDERLPSIREIAQSTSINPNTIQKALRELETEGFVYTVPGKGSFVAPRPKEINSERIDELYNMIKSIIAELIFLGAKENEIIEFIRTSCKGGNTP